MQGKNSKAKSQAQIEKVVSCFLEGSAEGRFGRYVIDGDRLVYRMASTSEFRITNQNKHAFIAQIEVGNIVLLDNTLDELKNREIVHTMLIKCKILLEEEVAKRLSQDGKTLYVGNAKILKLIGRKVNFGRVSHNRGVADVQNYMSTKIPMIDFDFFIGTDDLREQIEGWKHIMEQKPGYLKHRERAA
jgi:hypothetical protein